MVGVSFHIDKTGKRYVPKFRTSLQQPPRQHGHKPKIPEKGMGTEDHQDSLDAVTDGVAHDVLKKITMPNFEKVHLEAEQETSFTLNLFHDGFSISKPTKKGNAPSHVEIMQTLYPYDRTTENFLMAIDQNQLPGDLLNDIPCNFVDGCVVCEIQDFRPNTPLAVNENMIASWSPVVRKVTLRPTTESIVKDISAMAEENWTYQDLLEIESRIVNSVQPPICLEPSPDVAAQAFVSSYNKLKFNYGRPSTRRYQAMDPGLGRKIRLAATRALMKADGMNELRNDSNMGVEEQVIVSGKTESSCGQPQTSVSSQAMMQVSDHENVHGLSTSAPAPPPPFSLAAPAHDCNGSADTRAMGLWGHDKQDPNDMLSLENTDSKRFKHDQDRLERTMLQQMCFQKPPDAKDMHSLNQSSPQFKLESKQSLLQTPHQKEKICEMAAQADSAHLELKEMQNMKIEVQDNEHFYQKQDENEKCQHDGKISEAEEPLQLYQQQLRHPFGKLQPNPQQWQSIGQPLLQHDSRMDENRKKDELAQKRKFAQSLAQARLDNRGIQSSTIQRSPQLMQPSSPSTAFGAASTNSGDFPINTSVGLSSPTGSVTTRDKSQPSQAMPLTLMTTGMLEQAIHISQMPPSNMHLSKRRTNSLPKSGPGPLGPVLPSNASSCMPLTVVNTAPNVSATTTAGVKVEQGSSGQGQIKQPLDTLKSLVACVQRHGKHIREPKFDNFPQINRTPPSWQSLSLALADTSDDFREPNGQKSLANSLVGGSINARKTRFLQFTRTEPLYSGPNYSVIYHRTRLGLVLCGRGKDAMVEAVIQIGDDQDDETPTMGSYIVLPTLANAEAADRFARQYTTLLEKDGFELVEDQVQVFAPRGSTTTTVASTPHQSPVGAPSSLGTSFAPHSSPRTIASQNMPNLSDNLNQMQLPSPNALTGVRLQQQAMQQNRQLSMNYANQAGSTGSLKPLQQLDPSASQLAAIQQQQQQQQLQRPSQLLAANQLASQLGATSHNPGQQLPQMVMHSNLQQLQLLQQRQQNLLQRKMILPGGLGNLGNMNNMSGMGIPVSGVQAGIGNMVSGLGGINNVAGMAGMNNMTGSIGGISNLGNMSPLSNMGAINQNSGVANMINQQIRPGTMNQAQAVAAAASLQSKSRMAHGKIRPLNTANPPIRTNVDTISGMAATNPGHVSGGLNMMSTSLARSGLIPIQRAVVPGMGPSRVPVSSINAVTGQGYYINPQQLNSQQLNSQQLSNYQMASPQLNTQHLGSQQLNPQQISPRSLSVGGLGSLVGPQSPQLSSQTLGSVGSLTSSPIDRVGALSSSTGQGRPPNTQPQAGQT